MSVQHWIVYRNKDPVPVFNKPSEPRTYKSKDKMAGDDQDENKVEMGEEGIKEAKVEDDNEKLDGENKDQEEMGEEDIKAAEVEDGVEKLDQEETGVVEATEEVEQAFTKYLSSLEKILQA